MITVIIFITVIITVIIIIIIMIVTEYVLFRAQLSANVCYARFFRRVF